MFVLTGFPQVSDFYNLLCIFLVSIPFALLYFANLQLLESLHKDLYALDILNILHLYKFVFILTFGTFIFLFSHV